MGGRRGGVGRRLDVGGLKALAELVGCLMDRQFRSNGESCWVWWVDRGRRWVVVFGVGFGRYGLASNNMTIVERANRRMTSCRCSPCVKAHWWPSITALFLGDFGWRWAVVLLC